MFELFASLGKLDSASRARSYVEAQRVHVSAYTTPEKLSAHPNFAFGTPVLAARNPRQTGAVSKPAKPDPVPKRKPNKRVVESADEDGEDQAARLTERRERKRAKRAIVQPSGENDSKKENKRTTKNPPAFALMHGFSATNVGKNRLTIKPPSAVGVFKKGKASLSTKNKSSKARQSKPFSESEFLKDKAQSDASSAVSSIVVAKPKKNTRGKPAPVPEPNARQSEVWDIESPSRPMDEAIQSPIRGTVVVDAHRPSWQSVHHSSSPSLRPSESASQVKPRTLPVQPVSRFFHYPALSAESAKPAFPPALEDDEEEDEEDIAEDEDQDVDEETPADYNEAQDVATPLAVRNADQDIVAPPRFKIPVRKREFAERFVIRLPPLSRVLENVDMTPYAEEEQFDDWAEEDDGEEQMDAAYDQDDGDFDMEDYEGEVEGPFDDADLDLYRYAEAGVQEVAKADGYYVAGQKLDDVCQDGDLEDDGGNSIRFAEGRALLMGFGAVVGGVGEQDVVRSLRGHWKPVRL